MKKQSLAFLALFVAASAAFRPRKRAKPVVQTSPSGEVRSFYNPAPSTIKFRICGFSNFQEMLYSVGGPLPVGVRVIQHSTLVPSASHGMFNTDDWDKGAFYEYKRPLGILNFSECEDTLTFDPSEVATQFLNTERDLAKWVIENLNGEFEVRTTLNIIPGTIGGFMHNPELKWYDKIPDVPDDSLLTVMGQPGQLYPFIDTGAGLSLGYDVVETAPNTYYPYQPEHFFTIDGWIRDVVPRENRRWRDTPPTGDTGIKIRFQSAYNIT